MERAVLIASEEQIVLTDLPERIAGTQSRVAGRPESVPWTFEALLLEQPLIEAKQQVVAAFEMRHLTDLLQSARGRVGEAAKRARIHERSLYQLMRKHDLRKEEFRSRPAAVRTGRETG
jgi:DNA-binding NtrC family response regulator